MTTRDWLWRVNASWACREASPPLHSHHCVPAYAMIALWRLSSQEANNVFRPLSFPFPFLGMCESHVPTRIKQICDVRRSQ